MKSKIRTFKTAFVLALGLLFSLNVRAQIDCQICNPQVTTVQSANVENCTWAFQAISASNSLCPVIAYHWDFDNGHTAVTPTNQTSHSFEDLGFYEVCVVMEVDAGNNESCFSTPTCTNIAVGQACPTPCDDCNLQLSSITKTDITNCEKKFDVTGMAEPGCVILDYTWDLGDGSPEQVTGPSITHEYHSSGNVEVCVTLRTINTAGIYCTLEECLTVLIDSCENCTTDGAEMDNTPATAKYTYGGGFYYVNRCIYPGDEDWLLVDNGTYFIRVTGADPTVSGKYQIEFHPPNDNNGNCLTVETHPHAGSTTNTFVELFDFFDTVTPIMVDDNSGLGQFSYMEYCEGFRKQAAPAKSTSVYPNPAKAGQSIQLESVSGVNSLQMVDMTGRVVATFPQEALRKQSVVLPPYLSPGIYLLRSLESPMAPIRLMIR